MKVALERTRPHGRVIGIDLIPAQPPRGVASFQGDFLSPMVRKLVKDFIADSYQRQPAPPPSETSEDEDVTGDIAANQPSYIDMERHTGQHTETSAQSDDKAAPQHIVDVRPRSLPTIQIGRAHV